MFGCLVGLFAFHCLHRLVSNHFVHAFVSCFFGRFVCLGYAVELVTNLFMHVCCSFGWFALLRLLVCTVRLFILCCLVVVLGFADPELQSSTPLTARRLTLDVVVIIMGFIVIVVVIFIHSVVLASYVVIVKWSVRGLLLTMISIKEPQGLQSTRSA